MTQITVMYEAVQGSMDIQTILTVYMKSRDRFLYVLFNNHNKETTKVILIQEPKDNGLTAPTCTSRKQNVVKKS